MNEDEIRNAYSEKYPFIQKASEDLKDDMKALLEGKIHFVEKELNKIALC